MGLSYYPAIRAPTEYYKKKNEYYSVNRRLIDECLFGYTDFFCSGLLG